MDILGSMGEAFSRASLVGLQLSRLNKLLKDVSMRPFYRDWFQGEIPQLSELDQIRKLPLLEKADLIVAGQTAPGCHGLSPGG